MTGKTHRAALVLIPPRGIREPVQAIRRVHDRQFGRWMPHITLVYPFRPREEFDDCAARIETACGGVEPFTVALAGFRHFGHGRSFTAWLEPEPAAPLRELHSRLVARFPDCDDASRFEGGFTPHLSVGQAGSEPGLERLLSELSAAWQPVDFTAREVSMIWRGPETGDVFRVDRTVRLGPAAGI